MDIPSQLHNFENRLQDVNVVDSEALNEELTGLTNSSMETQVGVVLNDTEELNSPHSTENSLTRMLDGYDTEVVPDSDDELLETVESKRSLHRRVRLIRSFADDLDKVETSNINADACDDGIHVSSMTEDATEQNAKSKDISGVDDPCSTSALTGDINDIDSIEQLSKESNVSDCGRISPSERSDVRIVYTRKRNKTPNFEANDVKDEKSSSDKIVEYAGLSYVESQELDVSKALLFVDQYVGSNAVLSSPVSNITAKDKSWPTESGKGSHNFIRLANHKNREENNRVFEWNDSDEKSDPTCNSGQLSFRNKKNDQIYVRRSRSRSLISNEIGNPIILQNRNTEKVKDLTQTDAKHCTNAKMGEQNFEMKASEDSKVLDQEGNDESMVMQLETCLVQEESENAFDVGLDTQMAAEAIQALSFATSMECSKGDVANCRQKMLTESLEGSLKRIIAENWSFPRKVRSVASRRAVSWFKKIEKLPVVESSRVTTNLSSKSKAKRTKKRVYDSMDRRISSYSPIVDFTHKRKVNEAKDEFDGSKENLRKVLPIEQSTSHKVKCLRRHSANGPRETGIVHENDSGAKRTLLSEHLSGCTDALQLDREGENGFTSTIDDGNRKGNPTIQVNKNLISESVSPRYLIGNYSAQHVNKKASPSALTRELARLGVGEEIPKFTLSDSRRRRTMANIKVLLSKNLDEHTYNQQQKILKRFGVSMVSCSSVATHFISDKFARTRNMLEFIALGKPVVTHLWLESCQQAGCYIDESSYILRDMKKEQELGFRLPFSLDRAKKHPLLAGYKVIITPNTKPGKDMVTSLVKLVHGQVLGSECFCSQVLSQVLVESLNT